MTSLTVHTILEEATILSLLAEPEFAGNNDLLAARDVKPRSDHFLAVVVFSAEPLEDGSRLLRKSVPVHFTGRVCAALYPFVKQ